MQQLPSTGFNVNVNLEQAGVQSSRVLVQPSVHCDRFEAAFGLDREANFLA